LTDILVFKILIFGLFVVLVLWFLILLRRVPESEPQGLEIYTGKDGRVQVHKLKDWKHYKKWGSKPWTEL
jgi:hypothetical protein